MDYRHSLDDGLPVRESGAYAREKLTYVAKYQQIFATGMKNRFNDRGYVDLLSGPGRCVDRDSGEEFDGSPVLSLQAPFTARVFVESDPVLCSALRQRIPETAVVIEADCNQARVIVEMRDHLPASGLGLAFIDNLGLDVPFATIVALTEARRVDLMITFQVSDLTRNTANVVQGREDAERFDAFFGSHGWATVAENCAFRNMSPSDTATELLTFYSQQLNLIGYPAVAHSTMVMKNSRNVPLYRLLLAGRHPRATEFFRKIEAIDPVGRRRLF